MLNPPAAAPNPEGDDAVTDVASTKLPAPKKKADKDTMSENELVTLIAKQLKIDTYSPEKYPNAPELKDVISSDQAQHYKIIPLKKVGKLLVIAMSDPSDIRIQDQIRQFTNLDVEPVICTDAELNQLAQAVYGTTFSVKEMMSSLDGMDADAAKEEDDGAGSAELYFFQSGGRGCDLTKPGGSGSGAG